MRKTEINLHAQQIITMEPGTHKAIIDESGAIYLQVMQVADVAEEPAKDTDKSSEKPAAKKADVVDDTAPARSAKGGTKAKPAAEKPASTRRRKQAVEEQESDEDGSYVVIPEDEWPDLEEGQTVFAKLDMGDDENADPGKLWEATVVGMKKPKGVRDLKLFVKFKEDGQEDYLRDTDTLLEYKVNI